MAFTRRATLRVFTSIFMAGACSFALASCAGADRKLNDDLRAPSMADMSAPSRAPDADFMRPELKLAREHGLKNNQYFNDELAETVARLEGLEQTIGRLQSDLQGTAMAQQRVEMMRHEIEALNVKIQSMQERLVHADGTVMAPPAVEPGAVEPAPLEAQGAAGAPQALAAGAAATAATTATTAEGPMSVPATPVPAQTHEKAKPIVDDVPAKAEKQKDAKAGAERAAADGAPKADGVAGVRFGAHDGGKVRIVLDVYGKHDKFTANVDAAEKLLTIELPETAWTAAKAGDVKGNALVASYSAQPAGAGTVVAFSLKDVATVASSSTLKGGSGKPTRIVIDLAK